MPVDRVERPVAAFAPAPVPRARRAGVLSGWVPDLGVAVGEQAQLGHLPSGGTATGTTTVSLVDFATAGTSNAGTGGSNRLYADSRRNQIDMRFAKILRFNARRLDIGVDLQNLLNANYGTVYDTSFGTFGSAASTSFANPTSIVTPRFVRLNFTLNF